MDYAYAHYVFMYVCMYVCMCYYTYDTAQRSCQTFPRDVINLRPFRFPNLARQICIGGCTRMYVHTHTNIHTCMYAYTGQGKLLFIAYPVSWPH